MNQMKKILGALVLVVTVFAPTQIVLAEEPVQEKVAEVQTPSEGVAPAVGGFHLWKGVVWKGIVWKGISGKGSSAKES